jgi:recombination protein RecA
MFGPSETTTGGNALKFYSSVRLDIRRTGQIKDKEALIGNQTKIKVVKNKMAPPFKVIDVDVMYGEGISKTSELIDLGVWAGLVEKSGSWYSLGGEKMGQGKESAKTFLKNNPAKAADLETKIRAHAGQLAEKMLIGGVNTNVGSSGDVEVPEENGAASEPSGGSPGETPDGSATGDGGAPEEDGADVGGEELEEGEA